MLQAALLLTALVGLAAGLLWGRQPAGTDWQRARAVCIESDDWGLCGFVPDSAALRGLDRQALVPGSLPEVYWLSTLEDSSEVARLHDVLARHRGRDGLPAVIQTNYIMASLEFRPDRPDSARWLAHELPALPRRYARPGLWGAVAEARYAGVWYPELHGRWHYDPRMRRVRTRGDVVRGAAAAQILPFPGSERAWELGPWRDLERLEVELDANLVAFGRLFGRLPHAIMAPDYVWDDRHESLWLSRDLRVIQGQRQQRKPQWRGWRGRLEKIVHRTWTRWARRDRVYLDRNCIFEPVQSLDPAAVTARAAEAVETAWDRGQPAIVEAHRINFAHLDDDVSRRGREELDRFLAGVAAEQPLFLVDQELAQLQRRGTSVCSRGPTVVLRNLTRSRRLVVVPAGIIAEAARFENPDAQAPGSATVVALAPGQTRILRPTALIRH
jgi:hypothetical protein